MDSLVKKRRREISITRHGPRRGKSPDNEPKIRALLKKARLGDQFARNELLREHLGLVIKSAQQFYRKGAFLELEDLIQQGCLGLLHAVTKFDVRRRSKGRLVRFSTYAMYWINHFIRREIETRGRLVSLPINVQYLIAAYARTIHEDRTGDGGIHEIEKRLGISEKRLKALWLHAHERVPLETFPNDGDEPTNQEIRSGDYYQDDPEHLFNLIHIGERLRHLIGTLSDRERFILEHHYGMIPGIPEKTIQQIAHSMRLSTERIRQLRNRALSRLRKLGAAMFEETHSEDLNTHPQD